MWTQNLRWATFSGSRSLKVGSRDLLKRLDKYEKSNRHCEDKTVKWEYCSFMSQFKDCLPGICIPTIFALWWKVLTSFSFNSVQGYLGILAAADTGTVFQILQAIDCKVQLPQSRNWADRYIYKNREPPWGGEKACYMISAVILFTKLSCLAEMMVKTTNFFGSVLKKFTNL